MGLTCSSNFVTSMGLITYVVNQDISHLSHKISCSGTYGAPIYTAYPSLSILGGTVAISSTTGVISGVVGESPVGKTFFYILVVDNVVGKVGFFGVYISISSGEKTSSYPLTHSDQFAYENSSR